MHWGPYEIFSVISGALLVILALLPGQPVGRGWPLVGGLALVGYGFYVANQTTGTYYFPVWIFIVPVGAIVYLIVAVMKGRNRV